MYRLPPRLTDWSLALATGVAAASGLVSLISGRPDLWLVFALHGARRSLAPATALGQATACLAPPCPTPALGSPYRTRHFSLPWS